MDQQGFLHAFVIRRVIFARPFALLISGIDRQFQCTSQQGNVAFAGPHCHKSPMRSALFPRFDLTGSQFDGSARHTPAWVRCLAWSSLCAVLWTEANAQTSRTNLGSNEISQAYIREHYTKYEYSIPMRDGVKLFTAVYVPKDDSQPYPILLTRTPYSVKPYGVDRYPDPGGPMSNYAKEKFIFVACRTCAGANGSEGEFVHMRPHTAGEDPGRRTSTKAPTPTTRSTGW